jgi:glycosyltransferase involved in cell wall biosynthesis
MQVDTIAHTIKNGISVIICCYNSEKLLPETLRHIAAQKTVPALSWELIIVNNNSSDDTVAVAAREWNKYTGVAGRIRVVDEPRPGLTNARKKGVSEAQYEYIIFCDDDNWLHETYLATAYSTMQADNNIGALGGRAELATDSMLPAWWEAYSHDYAVGRQAGASGDITDRKFVWGAGLVLRKSLLLGIFDEELPFVLGDRNGNELGSGGDAEICARLILAGYKLWYDERLSLQHYMPPARLTPQYRDALRQGHIAAQIKLDEYYNLIYFGKLALKAKIKLTITYTRQLLLDYLYKKKQDKSLKEKMGYMWNRNLWNLEDFPEHLFRVKIILQKKRNAAILREI